MPSLRRFVTLDTRALALFRVYSGLLFAYSVLRRARYAALYTPDGLLPADVPSLEANLRYSPTPLWTIDPRALPYVFAISLALPLVYALGFHTRLFAILTFLALLTLDQRTAWLETGGDIAILLVAAFACFLPLSDRFSIDARSRRANAPTGRVAPAFLFFVFQWAFIYAVSAIAKHGPSWWRGTALVEALRVSRIATPIGAAFSRAPDSILRVGTWGAVVLELSLAFLLLWPRAIERRRAIAAALIVVLHSGIAITLNVGVFSFAMMSIVPLLLPARFFDRFVARTAGDDASEISRPRLAVLTIGLSLFAAATLYQLACERFRMPWINETRPAWFDRVADVLRFRQGWTLFAPQPPDIDDVLVVDALTVDGRHVDPFHAYTLRREAPLRFLPGHLGYSHFFAVFEDRLHRIGERARHEALARFIDRYPERTGRARDRIMSFDAFRLETSTVTAKRGDPRSIARARTAPIFARDRSIPVSIVRSRSVPFVALTIDGVSATPGSPDATPLGATFASSCAYVDYDLGAERSNVSVLMVASSESAFVFEGSLDGRSFRHLDSQGSVPDTKGQFPRRIALGQRRLRYLRVHPGGRGSANVSELRVFVDRTYESLAPLAASLLRERPIETSLPTLPMRVAALARPVAEGPCSGLRHERVLLPTDAAPPF